MNGRERVEFITTISFAHSVGKSTIHSGEGARACPGYSTSEAEGRRAKTVPGALCVSASGIVAGSIGVYGGAVASSHSTRVICPVKGTSLDNWELVVLLLRAMSEQREFEGMPKATGPRHGSNAWKVAEWRRFRELSRKHGGMIHPVFAAVRLGVSRQRVYQLLDSGALQRYSIMDKVFMASDEVEWFATLERGASFRYTADSAVA